MSQGGPRRPKIQERHSLGFPKKATNVTLYAQNTSLRYPNLHPKNSHKFLLICTIPKHSSRLTSQTSPKALLHSPNSSHTMSQNRFLGTFWDDFGNYLVILVIWLLGHKAHVSMSGGPDLIPISPSLTPRIPLVKARLSRSAGKECNGPQICSCGHVDPATHSRHLGLVYPGALARAQASPNSVHNDDILPDEECVPCVSRQQPHHQGNPICLCQEKLATESAIRFRCNMDFQSC
jgi:hypothetical protein